MFEIPEKLLQDIGNYLVSLPFGEVVGLINGLHACKKVEVKKE